MIAEIDKKLSSRSMPSCTTPTSSSSKSAWRGLHYLVNNTETDEMLKIRVLEHLQERARQDAQALQGHGLGPEPDLQEGLRTKSMVPSSAASRSAAGG